MTDATENAVTTPEVPAEVPAAPAAPDANPQADGASTRKPRRRGGRNKSGGDNTNTDAAAPAQASTGNGGGGNSGNGKNKARTPHPVLEKLFELYPGLFGARFMPLKRGVYEDLIARHPDTFKPEELKLAMGMHARSTRYLECVAAGNPRHDLDGQVVEPVAPEHVHHAILELYRRRMMRTPEEARAELHAQVVARIARAIEASGLEREDYAVLVRSRDPDTNAIVDEALASLAAQAAKAEALLRAFEASGRSEQDFADMYGMKPGEVARTLQRARVARPAASAT